MKTFYISCLPSCKLVSEVFCAKKPGYAMIMELRSFETLSWKNLLECGLREQHEKEDGDVVKSGGKKGGHV